MRPFKLLYASKFVKINPSLCFVDCNFAICSEKCEVETTSHQKMSLTTAKFFSPPHPLATMQSWSADHTGNMSYVFQKSVSKYVITTHYIKAVFDLYKYHTYMDSYVLIRRKEIIIEYVQILSTNAPIAPCNPDQRSSINLAERRSNSRWFSCGR